MESTGSRDSSISSMGNVPLTYNADESFADSSAGGMSDFATFNGGMPHSHSEPADVTGGVVVEIPDDGASTNGGLQGQRSSLLSPPVPPPPKEQVTELYGSSQDYDDILNSVEPRTFLYIAGADEPYLFRSCAECIEYVSENKLGQVQYDAEGLPMAPDSYWIDIKFPERPDPSFLDDSKYTAQLAAFRRDFESVELYFNLHELTREDCVQFTDSVEKYESYHNRNYSFAVLGTQGYNENLLEEVAWVHFLLTPVAVVTMHDKRLQCMQKVVDLCTTQLPHPSYVFYTFLDYYVDEAMPITDSSFDECEMISEIGEQLSGSEYQDLHLRISITRRKLMMLRRQLTGKQKLAQYLTSTRSTTASVPAPAPAHPPAQGGAPPPKNGRIGSLHLTSPSSFSQAGGMGLQRQSIRMPGPSSSNGSHGQKMAAISADSHISNETRVYMRDVLDHINSCMHKIETAREILNQAQSNYLSQVSIQMARSAAATDNSMKKLTILATGLLPLTIVTSAFGMNVKVPFQEEDSVLPFFLILIVTVTVSMTATGMYFGRQRARRRRYSDDNV